MDAALTARQRGAVVRQLAAREHRGAVRAAGAGVAAHDRPVGGGPPRGRVRRAGARAAAVRAGTDADVELAVGLKMENPARTAAQVRRILAARLGWAPSERAIQRWFSPGS